LEEVDASLFNDEENVYTTYPDPKRSESAPPLQLLRIVAPSTLISREQLVVVNVVAVFELLLRVHYGLGSL